MNENRFRNGSNGSGSTPSEAWLFAQELLGRPAYVSPPPDAEPKSERELREWVELISTRARDNLGFVQASAWRFESRLVFAIGWVWRRRWWQQR